MNIIKQIIGIDYKGYMFFQSSKGLWTFKYLSNR
jgi:hypothetical protein